MNAPSQTRVVAGYIVKVDVNGKTQYHGPFATDTRAREYARCFDAEFTSKLSIEELIIPHTIACYIETRF